MPPLRLFRAVRLAAALSALAVPCAGQKFLPDDPIPRDPDDLPIRKPNSVELSTTYDVLEHTFRHRPRGPVPRAQNVNTLGEVPDSTWFTNRIGRRTLTREELVRGPNRGEGPDLTRPWSVIRGKIGGISPGFTVRDAKGDVYFVKPDPRDHPNLSTAADVIGSKFFHAVGYNVPENHVAYVRREQLQVAGDARIRVPGGDRRAMREADLDALLAGVYRRADGAIRVVASRGLEGEDLGPHKYFGTRSDDPNDLFPHEHRRDLRGYRVFCAWLNHDDSRSLNSKDMYVGRDGEGHVVHYLLDFSSILGSGSNVRREIGPQNPRAGNEYVVEAGPILKAAVTLGLWERPWRKVSYPHHPEVGNLEAEFFQPERWRPEYPNPAFERMLPDDAFWAARIVSRFDDDAVRALVATGQFHDREAERYLADTLIKRRDKVVRHYFGQVNPLADFRVVAEGGAALVFENLGERAGLGRADAYEVQWFTFDNASGRAFPLGAPATVTASRAAVPDATAPFLRVTLRTRSAAHPAWARAVDVCLRRDGSTWTIVGIEREI